MSTKIVVTIDHLPYRELSANYRRSNFWAERAKVAKVARQEAFILAIQQRPPEPFKTCEIEEVFVVPTHRRVDVESYIQECKPFVDGIVQAGVIEDDGFECVRRLAGRVRYERGISKTEIIVTEVTNGNCT